MADSTDTAQDVTALIEALKAEAPPDDMVTGLACSCNNCAASCTMCPGTFDVEDLKVVRKAIDSSEAAARGAAVAIVRYKNRYRPAMRHEMPRKEADPMSVGTCVFLTPEGCALPRGAMPRECRETIDEHCLEDKPHFDFMPYEAPEVQLNVITASVDLEFVAEQMTRMRPLTYLLAYLVCEKEMMPEQAQYEVGSLYRMARRDGDFSLEMFRQYCNDYLGTDTKFRAYVKNTIKHEEVQDAFTKLVESLRQHPTHSLVRVCAAFKMAHHEGEFDKRKFEMLRRTKLGLPARDLD